MSNPNINGALTEIRRLERLQRFLSKDDASIKLNYDSYGRVHIAVHGYGELSDNEDMKTCLRAVDRDLVCAALKADVKQRLKDGRREIRAALDEALEGGEES